METNKSNQYTAEQLKTLSGYEIREKIEWLNSHSRHITESDYLAEMRVLIGEINRRGQEIAKKYKKKYRPLTYAELRTNAGFKNKEGTISEKS